MKGQELTDALKASLPEPKPRGAQTSIHLHIGGSMEQVKAASSLPTDQLLTVKEAAVFLRKKEKTIRNLMSLRKIRYFKPLGSPLFRVSDLEQMIQDSVVETRDFNYLRPALRGRPSQHVR